MICAEDEIGVGSSHDGIIVLPDGAAAPGTPAADYYQLSDDFVLEVDLTPNRIDAASHYGVARDLAAFLDCHIGTEAPRLMRPSVEVFASDCPDGDAVKVTVEADDACIRYCGLTIEGVNVTESPEWLRNRLTTVGLRPINNVVDITNYILHSFGHPLHAFDRAHIAGNHVVVKKPCRGTKFTTLDGVERTLDAADLMICNENEPMCIAGVFGGLDSGVTEKPHRYSSRAHASTPLQCARPHAATACRPTHRSATSAASTPTAACMPLKLAAILIKEMAGGKIISQPVDIYPTPVQPYPVELSYDAITRLIGQPIPSATVDTILRSLEIEVCSRTDADGGTMQLAVPTYRMDVRRPCDVIEDILRIYGYNNINIPTAIHASLSYQERRRRRRRPAPHRGRQPLGCRMVGNSQQLAHCQDLLRRPHNISRRKLR